MISENYYQIQNKALDLILQHDPNPIMAKPCGSVIRYGQITSMSDYDFIVYTYKKHSQIIHPLQGEDIKPGGIHIFFHNIIDRLSQLQELFFHPQRIYTPFTFCTNISISESLYINMTGLLIEHKKHILLSRELIYNTIEHTKKVFPLTINKNDNLENELPEQYDKWGFYRSLSSQIMYAINVCLSLHEQHTLVLLQKRIIYDRKEDYVNDYQNAMKKLQNLNFDFLQQHNVQKIDELYQIVKDREHDSKGDICCRYW